MLEGPAAKPQLATAKLRGAPLKQSLEDAEEEEERQIASAAFSLTATAPTESTLAGPGSYRGPIRYLGPGTPMELYWEYLAVCQARGTRPASQRTFYRLFGSIFATHLKFRNKSEHATCTICTAYKDRLRSASLAPRARAEVMALYLQHLASNYLDQQCSNNTVELSLTWSTLLMSGQLLASCSLSTSVGHLDVDGVDQAKFRVPRKLVKSHAFQTLIRPALHVQGVWWQGLAYHLAVSDGDVPKNTNSNVETMARCIEAVYLRCSLHLPMGLVIKQDNCQRECKNAKVVKFATMLVSLGVFRWVALTYWATGHTHCPLDGTYGQICVKLGFKEFDDDEHCLQLLQKILSELGVDRASREGATAYKMDQAADWEEWWEQVPLTLSNLTGPEAPHYFRVCRREDLGLLDRHGHAGSEETQCQIDRLLSTPPKAEDLLMVVKSRVSSLRVLQVVELMSAGARHHCLRIPQPRGVAPRRTMSRATRNKVAERAVSLGAQNVISQKATAYLRDWVQGARIQKPRPDRYAFLSSRWQVLQGALPPSEVAIPPLPLEPSGRRLLKAPPSSQAFAEELMQTSHRSKELMPQYVEVLAAALAGIHVLDDFSLTVLSN